jgi:hypothetical protein
MSVDEIKAMVMRFFDEQWNKGNMDVIDELCAANFTFTDAISVQGGRDELKRRIVGLRAISSDLLINIQEIITEGNRVAIRYTLVGTFEDRYSIFPGAVFAHIDNGKFVEYWFIDKEVTLDQPPT